jgi:hypothetical protein
MLTGMAPPLLIVVLYVFTSSILQYCFFTRGALASGNYNDTSHLSFSRMINWTAPWPYIYRTLIPSTVRMISHATPEDFKTRVNQWAKTKPFLQKIGWTSDYSYDLIVALALIHAIWVVQAFLLRHLIQLFYDLPEFVADLFPAFGMLFLTSFFISTWITIYDPGTSLMVSIGILLIAKRRYALYYLYFPLAVLHKLTAGMFIPVFVIRMFREVSLKKLLAHVALQLVLWACIIAGLLSFFGQNPGVRYHFQLFHNFRRLVLTPSPYHHVFDVVFLGTAILLIAYGWRNKPILLRKMFLAAGVAFIPGVLLFGRATDELRVWLDLFPFAFLLAVPTICDVFGITAQRSNDKEKGPQLERLSESPL